MQYPCKDIYEYNTSGSKYSSNQYKYVMDMVHS